MKRRRRSSLWVRFICFVGEGDGKLVARWRRGAEGVVWIQICLGEVVVCVSVTCSLLFYFFKLFNYTRGINNFKNKKNQKIYR